MKRYLLVMTLAVITVYLFVGCTQKMGLNIIRQIPLPEGYQALDQTTLQEGSEMVDTTAVATTEEGSTSETSIDTESILSLEALKEKAISKGYIPTDLLEFQVSFAGAEVTGFNIEIGSHLMAVMKFPTQEEAQKYINLVSLSGRFATLINGSYMSLVNTTDGVIDNPEELEIMEYLLDTTAQIHMK